MPNDAKCSRVSKIVTKFSLVEKRSTLEEPVKSPTPKRPDWFERRLQQFDNVTSLQSYGSDANRKKNGAGRESNAKEFPTKQSLPIERSDKKLETIADDGRVKQEQIVAVSWQEDSLRSQWFQSTTVSHKTSEETSREIPFEPNDCLHRVDEEKQLKKAAEEQKFAVNLPKDSLRNQLFQSTTISHKTSEETSREIPLEPNDCLHRVDEEKQLKKAAEEQTFAVNLPKDSLRNQLFQSTTISHKTSEETSREIPLEPNDCLHRVDEEKQLKKAAEEQTFAVNLPKDSLRNQLFQSTTISHKTSEETSREIPLEPNDCLHRVDEEKQLKKAAEEQTFAVNLPKDSLRNQWFQSTTISHKTSEETGREIPLEPNDCLHRVDEEKHLKNVAEEQTIVVSLPKDSLRSQSITSIVSQEATAGPQVVTLSEPKSFLIECHRPENVGKASTKADDGEEAPTPRTDSESSEETQLELKGFTVDREADEEAILRNPPERRRVHEGNDRPETLLDLKEFLNEYQNGRTIKDAATRNDTTKSRSDSRINEPPSATDEERARKTKKRPAKKKTNEATWKSVDFNLRGRRGDKLRPSNASSVDSIDRSSSRETPIVNATTDGSDSCAIVESETHAQTFYVDASDSSASDEGDRQRPNGRNAVLRASSYDEWEPLTPRRAFNRSDPAMISEATNWRVVDGLHDEAMWNDVERKMREISRSLTEDFRAADDDELALCSIPLHALNVTDYDERTKRFTSTVQIQLTGGGGGVKRSQSSKVGADVRHSSTSNSSFEAYESRAPMKTEIYYDENRMPRIEMVRSIDKNLCEVDGASSEKKSKLEYTVMELLETEEKYVEHLRMIKEDYIDYLRKRRQSDSWSSALRYLFGNLEEIYAKSRDFLADLRACRGDLTEIARAFSTHEDLFKLYPIYSRNKPHSDRYVENCFKDILLERQRQLKQMLDLASYLLMPVQRLGKYKLLLDNVRKQLTMEDAAVVDVDAAIALVGSQLRRSNDYIAIDSIRDWPRGKRYRCDALGAFVMREQFVVKNSRNRKRELATVFLFEDMLVFTQQVDKDSFAYRDHIRMSDLGLVIIDHEQSVFHLRRFPKDPKKEIDTYVMEAKSAAVKKTWVQHLQANLFRQLMTERQKRKSSVIPVHDCVHKIVNIAAAHNDRQRRRIDNIDDDNRIKSSTVTKRNVSLRRRPAMYNKKHDSYRTRSWQPSDDDDVVVEPEVEQKTGTYLNVAATIDGGAKTDQSKGLFVDDESDGGDVFGDEHRIDDTFPLEVHNYPRRDPFVLEFYNYHVCTEPTTDDDDRRNDDGCGKTFTGTKFKSKSIETVTARRKKTDGRRAFDRSKSTVLPPADNRQRSSIFYVDVFDFDASTTTTTSTWYTDYMDGKEAEDDGPTPSPNSVEEPDEDRVADGFSIDASLHDLILNASVSVPKLRRSHSCGDVIDERPDRVNSRRFSASLTDLMAQIDSLYDLGDARSSCLRRKRSSCYSSNATASEYRSKEDVAKSGKMLKYNYIVAELVQTEKTYAKTLEDILNNYVYYLEDNFGVQLTEDVRKLFGYLCKIFHKTINFIEDLDQCNGRWESIAKMFMKNRELFELYPPYSLYKYKSDNFLRHQLADILKERQLALRQPFDLPSYLLSPVQRLAKYKLLLNEMAKLDGTSKPLNYAILSIDKQLRIGNTFIAMASIRGLPYIGECELGMFVMRDYFQVKLGKRYQSCVFLFEKMIVFTTTMENEEFLYQMALKFTDIAIGSDNSGTTSFDLLHYMDVNGSGKKKRETVVTLDAKSLAVKRNWMEWIFKKLFEQMEEEKRKSATGSRPSQTPGAAATDVKKRRKAKKAKRVYVKSKRNGLPFLHLL